MFLEIESQLTHEELQEDTHRQPNNYKTCDLQFKSPSVTWKEFLQQKVHIKI